MAVNSFNQTAVPASLGFTAGKNKIINGDFEINQRAFSSSTSGASNLYNFDRWMQVSSGGTTTWSAQTFSAGTAPVAGYEGKNFLQIASTGQSAASDNSRIVQKIESVRTFANQTITISFWAKATSGTPNLASYAYQDFGTGGSPSAGVVVNGNKVTLSTSWARYSISISVPSISGKTIGTNNNDCLWIQFITSGGSDYNTQTNSIGIQSTTIQLWGIQVEAGSVATAFQTATGTLQGELAACQRYYWRTTSGTTYGYVGADGFVYTATNFQAKAQFPVTMRIAPTSIDFSNIAVQDASAGIFAITAVTNDTTVTSPTGAGFAATIAGGTTLRYGRILSNNNNAGYLGFSAEL
jgi:hypothetical protein